MYFSDLFNPCCLDTRHILSSSTSQAVNIHYLEYRSDLLLYLGNLRSLTWYATPDGSNSSRTALVLDVQLWPERRRYCVSRLASSQMQHCSRSAVSALLNF